MQFWCVNHNLKDLYYSLPLYDNFFSCPTLSNSSAHSMVATNVGIGWDIKLYIGLIDTESLCIKLNNLTIPKPCSALPYYVISCVGPGSKVMDHVEAYHFLHFSYILEHLKI